MALLALLFLPCTASANPGASESLSAYPHVPGLDQSPRYRFRVRELSSTTWQDPFAFHTFCKEGNQGYYSNALGSWSHTYCNFEMREGTLIEIEITRLDGSTGAAISIQTAVAHPRRKVRSWRVENGKAYIIIDRPMQFAVDIDGQMDTNIAPRATHSGSFPFKGPTARHGVTVFANPFIDKPDLNDPTVLAVEPGTIPPTTGDWQTLYFKPGVHQLWDDDWVLGDDFHIRSNRSYYIPGDAIVHGNMNNRNASSDGNYIRIYGHGTLSGERIPHAYFAMDPPLADADRWRTRGIRIAGAKGCRIEGITITDMPDHNALLESGYHTNPNDFNYTRWTKVIGWRANSDGLSPAAGGSGYVEDCFLRTQDDGSYIGGLGIRRMVYWTDAGGAPLRTSFVTARRNSSFPASLPQTLYIEDIDVIYARSQWQCDTINNPMIGAVGGATSNSGNTGAHVVFRNIFFTDPLPMRKFIAWVTNNEQQDQKGDIAGITFQNIHVTSPTVFGYREVFYGGAQAKFRNLIFDNVTMAGKRYTSLNDFLHNEHVSDFVFQNTGPFTLTYTGGSDYHKWYVQEDWSQGFHPADNDTVHHTAIPTDLIVDAPAWAGSLHIAHAGTASVSIRHGGKLAISSQLTLGSTAAPGNLTLADGVLELRNNNATAFTALNGKLHISRGTIQWQGNHIATLETRFHAGAIQIGTGLGSASTQGTLIGQTGPNSLYAHFNSDTGITTAWVKSNATQAGAITREWWTGISGGGVSNLTGNSNFPNNPSGSDTLASLQAVNWNTPGQTKDWANEYGQRIRGYLRAPQTGNYTFWISSDDSSELWLSTTHSADNRQLISSVSGFTNQLEWNKNASQKSAAIPLVAGQVYYLEVLHKENSGGDHVAVGWLKPGQSGTTPSEIVPGSALFPYNSGQAPQAPAAPSTLSANAISSWQINLSWTSNSNNADGFLIERSPTGSSDWNPIATVDADVTTWQDRILTPSTTHHYRIRAFNGMGSSAHSNTASATTQAALARAPYGGTASPLPGRIQAENYDLGGQNVAYLDNSLGNLGGAFRNDEVDIETTTDTDGGHHISHTSAGEWLEYTIEVAASARYDIHLRVASAVSNGHLRIRSNGTDITGLIAIPNTGGWNQWTTITIPGVPLTAGQQTMRVSIEGSGFNLNWIEAVGLPPATPTDLDATSPSSTQIDLEWSSDPLYNGGFLIEQSHTGTGDWVEITTVGTEARSVSDSGLTAATIYHYRIRAFDTYGTSEYSGHVQVMTLSATPGTAEGIGGTTHEYTDSDGIRWRAHSFTSVGSQTFTTNGPLDVEYLIVGGGGSGGSVNWNRGGGGGGAGGLFHGTITLPEANHPIVIGAGGVNSSDNRGTSGGASSAFGFTANGGGAGASNRTGPGLNGGSGGGGASINSGGPSNQGEPGLGHAGANGTDLANPNHRGGGGGGAMAAGGVDETQLGGAGFVSSISGTTQTYAHGGNGGVRPSSGRIHGTSGAPNTGDGGNGGASATTNNTATGGHGGSGSVILRYTVPDETPASPSTILVTGPITYAHDGSPKGPDTAKSTGSTGTITITYTGTGSTTYGPTTVKPVSPGSYHATATVAADENHQSATSAPYAFQISAPNPVSAPGD